ncbi:Crp/Fnr family transcriptional regulator [Marivita geojedonensis]|uniref:Crp/Fnr family transcriptional regulator n=1 Tax=Marivita geojedonensis TaxID=1123756 RepID=A0A1X4NCS6_9RHOB|nr:Crp/Fnr family transcriptional regulator [Marivita geojedonensis]OSQ44578.1 Crp/Fnr family transcriptional regulator [Marivita geojedonensis]PRY73300.1 CRP-like cAMP-binding protein [Marivita geojedonensis]
MKTDCHNCPLRKLDLFDPMSKDEVHFMSKFKTGEFVAQPGTEILAEGASSSQLYTALDGMGLRFKTLENGSRQVVGFILPGDFIGLQSGVMGEMQHSVEATTRMTMCVFNRSELWDLFKYQPRRAFDLTHVAATEEYLLGEALAAVGQMDGYAKISWVLNRFFRRLTALGLNENDQVPLPYRQQDIADAMGLSLVHTNKTLAKLREDGVATWANDTLTVHRPKMLAENAFERGTRLRTRPLI